MSINSNDKADHFFSGLWCKVGSKSRVGISVWLHQSNRCYTNSCGITEILFYQVSCVGFRAFITQHHKVMDGTLPKKDQPLPVYDRKSTCCVLYTPVLLPPCRFTKTSAIYPDLVWSGSISDFLWCWTETDILFRSLEASVAFATNLWCKVMKNGDCWNFEECRCVYAHACVRAQAHERLCLWKLFTVSMQQSPPVPKAALPTQLMAGMWKMTGWPRRWRQGMC